MIWTPENVHFWLRRFYNLLLVPACCLKSLPSIFSGTKLPHIIKLSAFWIHPSWHMHHTVRDRHREVLSSLNKNIAFYNLVLHQALIWFKIDCCLVNVRRANFYPAIHFLKRLLTGKIYDLQLVADSFSNSLSSYHLSTCIFYRDLLPEPFLDVERKSFEIKYSIFGSCSSEEHKVFFPTFLYDQHLGIFSTSRLFAVGPHFYSWPECREQGLRCRHCFWSLSIFYKLRIFRFYSCV